MKASSIVLLIYKCPNWRSRWYVQD